MNGADDEKLLGINGLAFSGAIIASVTHELNNVHSIIDQTSGLLEDLLAVAGPDRPVLPERLQSITEKIQAQTRRGVGIIKRLNTFAHSVDEPVREFEINQLLENLIELSRRFANLKKAELEVEYLPEPVSLVSNPFLLQQAVYLCYRQLLVDAEKGHTIRISIGRDNDGLGIVLTKQPPDSAATEFDAGYVKLIMSRLGGGYDLKHDENQTGFTLRLPLVKPNV